MVVVDNVLGPEHVTVMCRETIVVTDRGLLRGSTSTYSMVASETFEERYGDEPDISCTYVSVYLYIHTHTYIYICMHTYRSVPGHRNHDF